MWSITLGGALVCLTYFYLQSIEYQKEGVRRDVLHLAQSLAHLVDVDLHEQLTDPSQMGSPEHLEALNPLVRFHLKIPEIYYVYTIRAIDGEEYFILDTVYDPRVRAQRPGKTVLSEIMERYEMPDPNPDANPAMYRGDAYVYPLPYVDDFGKFISAQAPLFDRTGEYVGYAGVDYDISDYRERVNQIRIAGAGALVLAFIVSFVIANLTRRMREVEVALTRQRAVAEEALREAKERAEAANREKGEMLAMASHDLRNPLTSISGLTELMLLRLRDGRGRADMKDIEEDLVTMKSTTAQMLKLIENLLTTELIEQKGFRQSPAPFNLSDQCRDMLQSYELHASRKSITFCSRIDEGILVRGDSALLREATGNLVSNAIKYSQPGTTVTIELRTDSSRRRAVFTVTDEGPGLSREDQTRLFRKFQRLSATPTAGEPSTGLGLFIVKTIVEAHGGEVECRSTPGSGSRFSITLPLA